VRDPSTSIKPDIEAHIEETRRFLEPHVRHREWAGDDDHSHTMRVVEALAYINKSDMPEEIRKLISACLYREIGKRGSKPTRNYRNDALGEAAAQLYADHGYRPTRNDATRQKGQGETAATIIVKALKRLDETMTEKNVEAVISKYLVPTRVQEWPEGLTVEGYGPFVRGNLGHWVVKLVRTVPK